MSHDDTKPQLLMSEEERAEYERAVQAAKDLFLKRKPDDEGVKDERVR